MNIGVEVAQYHHAHELIFRVSEKLVCSRGSGCRKNFFTAHFRAGADKKSFPLDWDSADRIRYEILFYILSIINII